VLTKFIIYFDEDIIDFRLRRGFFLPRKFQLISGDLKLVSEGKETPSVG
jgi:hypothetical protein